MSRRYEVVEREVVKQRECVEVKCEMCGRLAENPTFSSPWEWGGVGDAEASLSYGYYIDGEEAREVVDLCYECASFLAEQIHSGAVKRVMKTIRKRPAAPAGD